MKQIKLRPHKSHSWHAGAEISSNALRPWAIVEGKLCLVANIFGLKKLNRELIPFRINRKNSICWTAVRNIVIAGFNHNNKFSSEVLQSEFLPVIVLWNIHELWLFEFEKSLQHSPQSSSPPPIFMDAIDQWRRCVSGSILLLFYFWWLLLWLMMRFLGRHLYLF